MLEEQPPRQVIETTETTTIQSLPLERTTTTNIKQVLATTAAATTITTTTIPEKPETQLYLAFGSNLSTSQMRSRCTMNPEISAKPLAIARLDGWRWLITERGYANVVPMDTAKDKEDDNGDGRRDGDSVYGLIYAMTKGDEKLLDIYEGIDRTAPSIPSDVAPDGVPRRIRPREQGAGSYNKWYLPVKVVEWVDEEFQRETGAVEELSAVVYVDEYRVTEGVSKVEYVARMNRGIQESVALGLPMDWVEKVMRRFIPAN